MQIPKDERLGSGSYPNLFKERETENKPIRGNNYFTLERSLLFFSQLLIVLIH